MSFIWRNWVFSLSSQRTYEYPILQQSKNIRSFMVATRLTSFLFENRNKPELTSFLFLSSYSISYKLKEISTEQSQNVRALQRGKKSDNKSNHRNNCKFNLGESKNIFSDLNPNFLIRRKWKPVKENSEAARKIPTTRKLDQEKTLDTPATKRRQH